MKKFTTTTKRNIIYYNDSGLNPVHYEIIRNWFVNDKQVTKEEYDQEFNNTDYYIKQNRKQLIEILKKNE